MRGRSVAVALSGGHDSVVLLHLLHGMAPRLGLRLSALHVNHGLSPNAAAWQRHCARLCRALGVPLRSVKVSVTKAGAGLEAAAREARRAAFLASDAEVIALAHHLDDQAETVLHNLLRGAGRAGARGMPAVSRLGRKSLVRPLLGVPRAVLHSWAEARGLRWIEDESNRDEALTRNFLRHRVGPLLATRFPRWRESLARAARHFAAGEPEAGDMLRAYLKSRGLRAPSEAKLADMLRQLAAGRATIEHDGSVLRLYGDRLHVEAKRAGAPFEPRAWNGEPRLPLPALGGELRFRRRRGEGIDRARVDGALQVRLRAGGERLQPDARRPRRSLKNLLQEARIPPWERVRMPLLYCGEALVWAPGLGVDAAWRAAKNRSGIVPEWRPDAS